METKELIQKKRDQKNIGGKTRISSRSAASSLSSESPRRLEDRLHETGLEGPMSAEAASEEEKDVEIRGGANASPSSSAARRSLPSLVFLLPTSSSLSFFDLLTLFLPSLPVSPPPPHTHPPTTASNNRAPKSPRPPACFPPCSTAGSRRSSGPPGHSGCCCCSGRAAPPRARSHRSTPSRSCRSLAAPRPPTRAAPTAPCRSSTTRTRTRTLPPRPTSPSRSPRRIRRSQTTQRARTTRSTGTRTASSPRG